MGDGVVPPILHGTKLSKSTPSRPSRPQTTKRGPRKSDTSPPGLYLPSQNPKARVLNEGAGLCSFLTTNKPSLAYNLQQIGLSKRNLGWGGKVVATRITVYRWIELNSNSRRWAGRHRFCEGGGLLAAARLGFSGMRRCARQPSERGPKAAVTVCHCV